MALSLWSFFGLLTNFLMTVVASEEELHDFGKALATGLCKLPGLKPIVSFPQWGKEVTPDQPDFSLGVVHGKNFLKPFQGSPRHVFLELVSVQSLFCSQTNPGVMWVLDSGHSPGGQNLTEAAAKLLKVSLMPSGGEGRLDRIYTFPRSVLPPTGYLNDVRVDGKGFAYITDSNSGSIVVLSLASGKSHVWTDERMSVHLESGEKFQIGEKDMSFLPAQVDGIAYSKFDDMLYWKPVVRSSLYGIKAQRVRDAFETQEACVSLNNDSCRNKLAGMSSLVRDVNDMGKVGFHDGLDADLQGNVYLTDLVQGSIQCLARNGTLSLMTDQQAMHWPDCVIVAEGSLFVLTTQVHLMPFLNEGKDLRQDGNKLLRIPVPSHAVIPMGKLEAALSGTSGFPTAMPAVPELSVPEQLACAARILSNTGYALDVAGHITVAHDGIPNAMWSTPYGVWWRDMTSEDMLIVSEDGNVLEGSWDVTPAIAIHTELHRSRPDARVVLHNHPYYGSLLAAMHEVPEIADQQACMFDGDIVLFDEYTGGIDNPTDGQYLVSRIGNATAILLANHGVLIVGETVQQVAYRAATFERTCRLHYDTVAAGRAPKAVPKSTRNMLKRSLNTISVDNFWRGEVRRLLRTEPEVLGSLGGEDIPDTCSTSR